MNLKRIGLVALGIVSAAASALPVGAVPYLGNNVYRTQETGRDYVYVSAPANSEVVMSSAGSATSARLANACGIIALSQPTGGWVGSIQVAGRTVNPATLPTQLLPSCTNGVLNEARTADFKDSNGRVYLVGFTAGSSQTVSIGRNVSRRATANACGFARFVITTPMPNFTIGTNNYVFATMAQAGVSGPICRNNVPFVPYNWEPNS